jgi:hypothetical protein
LGDTPDGVGDTAVPDGPVGVGETAVPDGPVGVGDTPVKDDPPGFCTLVGNGMPVGVGRGGNGVIGGRVVMSDGIGAGAPGVITGTCGSTGVVCRAAGIGCSWTA